MSNLDVSVTLRLVNQMRGQKVADELNRIKMAAMKVEDAGSGRLAAALRTAGTATATLGQHLDRAAMAGGRISTSLSGIRGAIRGAGSAAKGLAADFDRAAAAAGRLSLRNIRARHPSDPSRRAATSGMDERNLRVPRSRLPVDLGSVSAAIAPAALGYGAARSFAAYADIERRMTRVGITGEASREEMRAVTTEAQKMALSTGLSFDQIARGFEALAAQGRKMADIRAFMPSVAATAQASGADVADIANSAGAVSEQLGISAKRMQAAFDIMVQAGNEGKFELKDMARYLPSLAPAAAAVGLKGEEGLKRLVAMLQVIRNQTGDAQEAATSLQNIFTKMESKETTKHFKEFGVDLGKAMGKARAEGRDLVTVLTELADQALKGDLSKVPRIFADTEFARGMRALLSQKGAVDALVNGALSKAEGSVQTALGRVLEDSKAKIDAMSNSWETFKARLGEAVSPAAVPLLDTLSRSLKTITDAVDEAKAQTTKPGQMLPDAAQAKINKWANLLQYGDTLGGAPRDMAYLRSGAHRADAARAREQLQAQIADREAYLSRREGTSYALLRPEALAEVRNAVAALKERKKAIDGAVNEIDAAMASLDTIKAARARYDSLRMARPFDPKAPEFGFFPTRDPKRNLSFGPGGAPQIAPLWGDTSVPVKALLEKMGPRSIRMEDILGKGAPGGLDLGSVRAEMDRVLGAAGKLKAELGTDMSGAASRSMAGYASAINSGLDVAISGAKAKVAALQATLSFTATPTISPTLSTPRAPAAGGGSGASPGKGASLRGSGSSGPMIQTAHFHGIRDVAAFQRQVARIQDRAIRDERDGALHDIA